MKYEIVEMQELSGDESKVYSVIPIGEEITLFEKFVDEYELEFKNEIKDILARLYQIGHITGARSSFLSNMRANPEILFVRCMIFRKKIYAYFVFDLVWM